jgi:HSP20 family molecular chaperone IbpA
MLRLLGNMLGGGGHFDRHYHRHRSSWNDCDNPGDFVHRTVDNLCRDVKDVIGYCGVGGNGYHRWTPRYRFEHDADKWRVKIDVPGMAASDFRLSVDHHVLKLSGHRDIDHGGYEHHHNDHYDDGHFELCIDLPNNISEPSIVTALADGELCVEFDKEPWNNGGTIAVPTPPPA